MNSPYVVLLLQSTSQAVRGEHLLHRAGISAILIPVPRSLAADCGVCLRVGRADLAQALAALREGKLEPAATHDL